LEQPLAFLLMDGACRIGICTYCVFSLKYYNFLGFGIVLDYFMGLAMHD
jgi:hypothetical protein